MAKKQKREAAPQEGNTKVKENPQPRTPEQVEAYLKEKNEASELSFIGYREEGYTPEEIIEECHLKGVTPEQVEAYIKKETLIDALIFTENASAAISDEELSEETGVALSDVTATRITFENTLSTLTKQKKSAKVIAEALNIPEHVVEDAVTSAALRDRVKDVIEYYCYQWRAENIAKERGEEEEEIVAILDAFKEKVLKKTAEGRSVEEIAALLSCSPQGVIDALAEQKEEIANLQAVSMQRFVREHKAGYRERLGRLSALRDHLMQEINERGLKEVSVDKLIALYLKTEESLRAEEKEGTPIVTSSKNSLWEKIEVPLS